MPYTRRLPSGLWQATVRHPSGRRITKTDRLKKVVDDWARDEEARYARGDRRDPRAGHITIDEWYRRWMPSRGVEPGTKAKDESRWRTHCDEKWGTWPMDSVTRMEAQGWVRELEAKPRARWGGRPSSTEDDWPFLMASTIHGIVGLMTNLYASAMRETPPIVLSNPFLNLDLPTIPPSRVVFFSHAEADAIIEHLRANFKPRWWVLVALGMWSGLRWQELAVLRGDRVSWLREEVEVTRVWTPYGVREYPKSKKSHRVVPVPPWVMEGMSTLMRSRDRDEAIFKAMHGTSRGEYPAIADFHSRIWYPTLKAVRMCDRCPAGCSRPEHQVTRHNPHVMRHTAASWLVQDGVDLYRVQDLLGHESFATTQRYAHLAPDRHEAIRKAWRDARPTHDSKKDQRGPGLQAV